MKFSFPFFKRKPETKVVTGAVFRSPVITPEVAKMVHDVKEFNKRQMRMYDAAVTDNYNADMPGTYGSANAEILTSSYLARARSRSAVKDYPTAKGAARTKKNNIVGDEPFKLEMKVGKKTGKTFELETDTNSEIEQAWKEAGLPENCDTRGEMSRLEMYHCVCASIVRDGHIIARHHDEYPFNKFGYALELIECDRLQESYQGRAPITGNPIRFSIERDKKYLRPVAYWILNRHPGDPFQWTDKNKPWRDRVSADEIIHFNVMRDRAEQDIGMLEFDSVIQHLHRLRQWDIAYIYAAISNAGNPLFFVKEQATGLSYVGDPSPYMNQIQSESGAQEIPTNEQVGGTSAPGGPQGEGVNKHRIQKPGMAEELDWGLKPYQTNPKFPLEAAAAFNKNNLEQAAVGIGISYAELSGDFSNMSFSAARMAMLPQRRNFKVDQKHMIISFVRLHFNAWLKCFLMSGKTKLPLSRYDEFVQAAEFSGQQWDYINPMQDVQADVIAVEAKIKSRGQVIKEREGGTNFETVVAELAEENKIAKDAGIDLTQDASNPTLKKGEPGTTQPANNGQPAPTNNGNARFELNGHH